MTEKTLTVATNLEPRPSAIFVQTASKFSSHIEINLDNKKINAKSIMGMISLGILDGQTIRITAEGKDEQQAIDELNKFLTKA